MALPFFSRLDSSPEAELFRSSGSTRGPWDPRHQHGGPPTALLGTVVEQRHPRDDAQVVRVTAEILRPVPITDLVIRTSLERGGRSVELLSASMETADGTEVMRASVWRIRTAEVGVEPVSAPYAEVAPPSAGGPVAPFPGSEGEGYLSSMEWSFVAGGGFLQMGPATAWGRMRAPLIEGEPIHPLARVLIIADSGNGISCTLDIRSWMFINPDLTVVLRRMPRGEWVCLDAATSVEPHGIGLAESVLHDEQGPIGRGLQTLLIAPR